MVDPNRKINLSTSDDSSDENEFNDDEVHLIKDFEEKFKDRFTDKDEEFEEVCKKKLPSPPILEWNVYYPGQKRPYYNNYHNQNRGRGRGNYHHRNDRNYDNYNRKRPHYDNRDQRDNRDERNNRDQRDHRDQRDQRNNRDYQPPRSRPRYE